MGNTELGHEELARALYDRHAPSLLAYAQRLTGGDRQLAEDIVQETLVRAWRHGTELCVDTARPWLFTTARNVAIDSFRARRVRPAETSAAALDAVVTTGDIDKTLNAVVVADALTSLSSVHRDVLVECYYRGRTAAEVATERGLPAGTVRSRIHYALQALRLALQERGVSG
jgi:RNA polymerase sigma-70 factor, ECF subfamily